MIPTEPNLASMRMIVNVRVLEAAYYLLLSMYMAQFRTSWLKEEKKNEITTWTLDPTP